MKLIDIYNQQLMILNNEKITLQDEINYRLDKKDTETKHLRIHRVNKEIDIINIKIEIINIKIKRL